MRLYCIFIPFSLITLAVCFALRLLEHQNMNGFDVCASATHNSNVIHTADVIIGTRVINTQYGLRKLFSVGFLNPGISFQLFGYELLLLAFTRRRISCHKATQL